MYITTEESDSLDHLAAADHVGHLDHLVLAAAEQELRGDGVEGEVPHYLPAQSHEVAELLIQHVEPPGPEPGEQRVGAGLRDDDHTLRVQMFIDII